MITADTMVARLLQQHPELLEVLARYHPHFKLLGQRRLRRVIAPPVTLAQVAQMAGVSSAELLDTLSEALGEKDANPRAEPSRPATTPGAVEARPEELANLPASRQVRLDVREDIERNEEPFARIMAVVKTLQADQALVLQAPFEPIPLYEVLGRRGLRHWTEPAAPGDWIVWFYRGVDRAAGEPVMREVGVAPAVLDVRGLEPPQPMVRVLEALERLRPDGRLEVLHDRRPMFLYPQLDERGFAHETEEPEPGLVRILIRRREASA